MKMVYSKEKCVECGNSFFWFRPEGWEMFAICDKCLKKHMEGKDESEIF